MKKTVLMAALVVGGTISTSDTAHAQGYGLDSVIQHSCVKTQVGDATHIECDTTRVTLYKAPLGPPPKRAPRRPAASASAPTAAPDPALTPDLNPRWGLGLMLTQSFTADLLYPSAILPGAGHWYAYPGMNDGANRNGTLRRVRDPSAPASPPFVLRVKFPAGLPAGSAPVGFGGWAPDYAAAPSTNIDREIYVSMWIKIGDGNGFENHPIGTKIAYWGYGETPKAGIRQGYLLWENLGGGQGVQASGRLTFFQQNVVSRRLEANVGGNTLGTGVWHQIEFHCRQNSAPDVPDGVLEAWVDGRKTHSYGDIVYRTSAAPYGFTGWKGDPVWGGYSGPVKTRDDYIYYDHVLVFAK